MFHLTVHPAISNSCTTLQKGSKEIVDQNSGNRQTQGQSIPNIYAGYAFLVGWPKLHPRFFLHFPGACLSQPIDMFWFRFKGTLMMLRGRIYYLPIHRFHHSPDHGHAAPMLGDLALDAYRGP